jgi:lysophospholipase L1-like esterase
MMPASSTASGLVLALPVALGLFVVAGCARNPQALSAPTLIARRGDTSWDYVALGDSTPTGYGLLESYVEYYAAFIEEDLGVKVDIHNFAQDGQSTRVLLDHLRGSDKLRETIEDAEVITIWTGWNDLKRPMESYHNGTCGGADNLDCIREAVEGLNSNMDLILDEILSLSSPADTLIRIADAGNPFVAVWKEQGRFDDLKGPCFEAWRDHIVESAEQRGVTVVYTYHVLNGPHGDESIAESLTQADGLHFSKEGHRLLARLHREIGYSYVSLRS